MAARMQHNRNATARVRISYPLGVTMELRAEGGRRLVGTVVNYNDVADRKAFLERFTPGSLDYSDVLLYAQHERSQPLARMPGTMEFRDSAESLDMVATLPRTQLCDDVLALVSSRVLCGLSAGFVSVRDRMDGNVRVIDEAILDHVGVVDRPSYSESLVSVRNNQIRDADGGDVRALSRRHLPLGPAPVRRRRVWL